MKEECWEEADFTRIQATTRDVDYQEKKAKTGRKTLLSKLEIDIKWTILLCLILFLTTTFAIYTLWNIHHNYLGDLKKFERRTDISDINIEEYPWDHTTGESSTIRLVRSAANHAQKKYVVSYETRLVSCSRFKPTPRGKYLVTPSLATLHACYERGLRLDEPDEGTILDSPRYELDDLYVACDLAFDDSLDELTDELRVDYERCKWSGGLSSEQRRKIEERFAAQLATVDQNDAPLSTTEPSEIGIDNSSSPAALDPRGFVECSHVETELVDDYFESPSYEALQRCEKFGVTLDELRRGVASNPRPDRTTDVGSLYVGCMYVFGGELSYMTGELRDDYLRCKSVEAVTAGVQRLLETRFYELLHEERGESGAATEKTTEKPATSSAPVSSEQATSKRSRYAFANCKRIENRAYLICIKIIKVYSAPIPH